MIDFREGGLYRLLGHARAYQMTGRDSSIEGVDSQEDWKEQPSKKMSGVEIVRCSKTRGL